VALEMLDAAGTGFRKPRYLAAIFGVLLERERDFVALVENQKR
jgi:hypothetical protein